MILSEWYSLSIPDTDYPESGTYNIPCFEESYIDLQLTGLFRWYTLIHMYVVQWNLSMTKCVAKLLNAL